MLGHKYVMRSPDICTLIQKLHNMAAADAFQAEEHEYCCFHGVIFPDGEQLLVKFQTTQSTVICYVLKTCKHYFVFPNKTE